jgi:hypothetical protein
MRESLIYILFALVLALLSGWAYFAAYSENGMAPEPTDADLNKPLSSQPPTLTPDDSFVLTELKGQNLSYYSALWWTWIYSIPREKVSPIIDPDGQSCGFNQSGDVWFLAGTPGDDLKYVRDCSIPRGKHIFFPVFTLISKTKPICSSAQIRAEIEPERLLSIEVVLDDKIIPDPTKFRAKSPGCFRLKGYIQGKYDGLGVYPVATDGYWILLKPLEPGLHTLRFKAEYATSRATHNEGKEEAAKVGIRQDVIYNLKIE